MEQLDSFQATALVVAGLVYGVLGFVAIRNAVKTKRRSTVTLALAIVFAPIAVSALLYAT